jgi:hypothetical protein
MYSYRFVVQHSHKLFEVSSICLHTFSVSCYQRTCNLTKHCRLFILLRVWSGGAEFRVTLCQYCRILLPRPLPFRTVVWAWVRISLTLPVAFSMHIREQAWICEFSFFHNSSVEGYVFLKYDFGPLGNPFLAFRMNVLPSSSRVPMS